MFCSVFSLEVVATCCPIVIIYYLHLSVLLILCRRGMCDLWTAVVEFATGQSVRKRLQVRHTAPHALNWQTVENPNIKVSNRSRTWRHYSSSSTRCICAKPCQNHDILASYIQYQTKIERRKEKKNRTHLSSQPNPLRQRPQILIPPFINLKIRMPKHERRELSRGLQRPHRSFFLPTATTVNIHLLFFIHVDNLL